MTKLNQSTETERLDCRKRAGLLIIAKHNKRLSNQAGMSVIFFDDRLFGIEWETGSAINDCLLYLDDSPLKSNVMSIEIILGELYPVESLLKKTGEHLSLDDLALVIGSMDYANNEAHKLVNIRDGINIEMYTSQVLDRLCHAISILIPSDMPTVGGVQ